MADAEGGATTDASSEQNQALRAPFEAWLAKRWPSASDLTVLPFESPRSGFSAKTLFAPVHYRHDGERVEERVVLRVENPEPAIYPVQAPGLDVEIEIQYRVMQGLHAVGGIPLAELIGYEPDPSVLGAPFFAMRHVRGNVATENPPYTKEGFFVDASPASRRAMVESGLRILADVHRIDWRAAGFDWLVPRGTTPGLETQLELWERYGRRELRDRVQPVFDEGVRWLRAHLPSGLESRLSWGDSRMGNILFDGDRPAAITDFENAAIAPAEIDLGWWLMFDRTQHEVVSAERLPGEPTREEQRDFYYAAAGRDLGDTHYFEVFAAMRYAAIVVRVMNRAEQRGLVPADHPIWLANPASQCLADLLGMQAPW
jgi:aminoglycoside phosphotransferase (APT) family kinase protein